MTAKGNYVTATSNLPPVTLPSTSTHIVESRSIPDKLRIDVATPLEYAESTRSYPLVYLLDGYWFFAIVSETMRLLEIAGEMPPAIIVGVGYETAGMPRAEARAAEYARLLQLRCRDLTPTRDDSDWWHKAGAPAPILGRFETGGAEEFLGALVRDVKPLVYRNYRADSGDETLAGYSLGGLFALYTLFCHTDLFNCYVAGSPSLWWGDEVMFEFEQQYARKNTDLNKTLFLSMGGLEESGAGAACRMVSNLRLFIERLSVRRYPSLRWQSVILEGETHATGIASAFVKGLVSVFARVRQSGSDG